MTNNSPKIEFDSQNFRPMADAINADDISEVKMLAYNFPQLLNEVTPLGSWVFYSVRKNNLKALNCLIELGANINLGSSDGDTPLCFGAVKGYTEIVKTLLSKGAKYSTKTQRENPLFAAIGSGNAQTVSVFLEVGIDPTIRYDEDGGMDATTHAFVQGHRTIVQQLTDWIAERKGQDPKSVYKQALDYAEDLLETKLER